MAKTEPRITKEKWDAEVLTRGKMEPIVADIKDFIKTVVKGTEYALREDTRRQIDEVKKQLGGVEKRLDEKIDGVESRLEKRLVNVEKIVSDISTKMDNHETRLSTVEEKIENHLTAHP